MARTFNEVSSALAVLGLAPLLPPSPDTFSDDSSAAGWNPAPPRPRPLVGVVFSNPSNPTDPTSGENPQTPAPAPGSPLPPAEAGLGAQGDPPTQSTDTEAGCRRIAQTFNRLRLDHRDMTVGKTFVSGVLRDRGKEVSPASTPDQAPAAASDCPQRGLGPRLDLGSRF